MVGIAQMQAGNRLGDIGHAVQQHAEAEGFGVVRGAGRPRRRTQRCTRTAGAQLRQAGTGTILRTGLVLAIEPMITEGSWAKLKPSTTAGRSLPEDGKLAAHFEHTIAITDQGPKILTLRDVYEHPDVAHYRPQQEVAA